MIMRRIFYISVFLLLVFAAGCSGAGEVNSIYSIGVYDMTAGSVQDMNALERYLRSVDCPVDECFVVEGDNIQENNRKAVEKFGSVASNIDYALLREMLSDDISFTYAVVCGGSMDKVTYLDCIEFSAAFSEHGSE